ncbi:S-layer homology domain-containing protein [Paenibacillus sp. OV219]|uniref:S-layer homology domain-containing protein n=1 Tax=Paenibacillus sp. OV219 TaxID=1884377 RepID=UPI0008C3FB0D|nr:S-layer homology domain-containing protein [Paenibacillus sp. OV219]SEO74538.1 S-layer homology domain-containing protein [Paenibacillus sp. OV219]
MRSLRVLLALFVLVFAVQLFPDTKQLVHAEESTGATATFPDIKAHWAQSQIERLAEMAIIKGYPDGKFLPNQNVTREQFVSMLVNTLGYSVEDASATGAVFADVAASRWSSGAIAAALREGTLVKSEYGTNFKPAQAITRNEMAIMIARALKLDPNEKALDFKDKTSIKSHPELVGAIVEAKIITGFPDQTFRPAGTLTRAQSAIALINMLDTALKSQDPDVPTPLVHRDAANEVTYQSGVTEITDPQQVKSLSSDGELVLDNTAEIPEAGELVVLPAMEGYPFGVAKRIVSVATENGQIVAQTEEPEFQDVIDQIDVQKTVQMQLANLDPASVPEGITINKIPEPAVAASPTISLKNKTEGFEIGIKGLEFQPEFKDDYAGEVDKSKVKIALSGKLLIGQPQVTLDYDYSFWKGLKSFQLEYASTDKVEVEVSLKGEASASATYTNNSDVTRVFDAKASFLTFEKDISLATFYVPVAGPVGVQATLQLKVKADASLGITETVTATFTRDVGLVKSHGEYQPIMKFSQNIEAVGKGAGQIGAGLGPDMSMAASILQFANAGLRLGAGIEGKIAVFAGGKVTVSDEVNAANPSESSIDADGEPFACYIYGVNWYLNAGAFIKIPHVLTLDFPILDLKKPIIAEDTCKKPDQPKVDDTDKTDSDEKPAEPTDSDKPDTGGDTPSGQASLQKTVVANLEWQNMLHLNKGEQVTLTAVDGKWNIWPGQGDTFWCDANGYPLAIDQTLASKSRSEVPDHPWGALIGKTRTASGAETKFFVGGESMTITASEDMDLFLEISDDPGYFADNQGSITVKFDKTSQSQKVSVSASQDPSQSGYTNTGITLAKGQTVNVTATGIGYYSGFDSYFTDADGYQFLSSSADRLSPKMDSMAMVSIAPIGTLVGVIQMSDGSLSGPIVLGTNQTFTVPADGVLLLMYNDDPGYYGNNYGGYDVTVSVSSN